MQTPALFLPGSSAKASVPAAAGGYLFGSQAPHKNRQYILAGPQMWALILNGQRKTRDDSTTFAKPSTLLAANLYVLSEVWIVPYEDLVITHPAMLAL